MLAVLASGTILHPVICDAPHDEIVFVFELYIDICSMHSYK